MFLFSGKCSPFERCLQEPFRKHKHLVQMYIIDKAILHPGDKSAPTAGKFLKFGTVDAGRVRPRWFSLRSNSLVSAKRKLIGSGESDDRGHSLVCVYVGMRFYAVCLLPTPLEYEAGAKEYGCRILKFPDGWALTESAVFRPFDIFAFSPPAIPEFHRLCSPKKTGCHHKKQASVCCTYCRGGFSSCMGIIQMPVYTIIEDKRTNYDVRKNLLYPES